MEGIQPKPLVGFIGAGRRMRLPQLLDCLSQNSRVQICHQHSSHWTQRQYVGFLLIASASFHEDPDEGFLNRQAVTLFVADS
jgi:hypothetical protein